MKGKKVVEHTNDWSIVSKRSMVELGYFKDDYLKLFSSKKRRSPLINVCYYVRAYVLDKVMRHILCLNSSKFQIISLGAGFDTTYFRLFSKENNVKFVEIDLPFVVKTKVEILLKSNETKEMFSNYKVESNNERAENYYFMSSDNYIIFSQNLDNTEMLDVRLKQFGIYYSMPTVLLSEVAITYMDEGSCTKLCQFLGKTFTNSALLLYEQINPDDGFGQFMMNHFRTIQSPLKSLTRYNLVKDPSQFYISNGWEKCVMHRVMDLYEHITSSEVFKSIIRLEPLDEWEEFHLTCLHYGLYIASNGVLANIFDGLIGKPKIYRPQVEKELFWFAIPICNPVERFGHSLLNFENNLLIFGGVAVENRSHKKTSLCQIFNPERRDITDIESRFDQLALTHKASCNFYLENLSCGFVHGGCKSPVQSGDLDPLVIIQAETSLRLHKVTSEFESVKPCHRWRHTVASIKSDIFIFGGRTFDLKVLNDFWKINLTLNSGVWTGKWTEMDKGPTGRFSHSCVSMSDNSLIISGGVDVNIQPLGDVWKWSSSTGWSEIVIDVSIPRYGHTSHLVNDKLFLIGGVSFHPSNPGVTIIDLSCGKAVHYLLPVGDPSQPVMLHNHQSTLSKDQEHIIIIGGGGNCFSFGTSFNRNIIDIPLNQFLN